MELGRSSSFDRLKEMGSGEGPKPADTHQNPALAHLVPRMSFVLSPRFLPRNAAQQPRDFQCPEGTHNCLQDLGLSNSCCAMGDVCVFIVNSGPGSVGCCPSGQTCTGTASLTSSIPTTSSSSTQSAISATTSSQTPSKSFTNLASSTAKMVGTTTSPILATATPTITAANPPDSHGLLPGGVAGVAIGGVVLVVAIWRIIAYIRRLALS